MPVMLSFCFPLQALIMQVGLDLVKNNFVCKLSFSRTLAKLAISGVYQLETVYKVDEPAVCLLQILMSFSNVLVAT